MSAKTETDPDEPAETNRTRTAPSPRPVEAGPDEPKADAELDLDEVVPRPPVGALAPLRNPVGRFLAEARRYPRLSDEEERSSATRFASTAT